MEKIDFVITWVDGSDPAWQQQKNKYIDSIDTDNDQDANVECRYREQGFLKYWFRCVEKNAPWVDKIHFVTCGQKPEWLVENHPKLNYVDHRDFIPEEYLPTFNSNTIELNLHRIPGLSEHFVLFNDDMYVLQPIQPSFYFHKGNPVLVSSLMYPKDFCFDNISIIMFHNYCEVNNHFDIKQSINENSSKWYSISALGWRRALRNMLCHFANSTLLPVGDFGHIPQPHLKSTFEEIWQRDYETMHNTCLFKFRHNDQVNHWLCCAWNQAKGCFYPAHENKRGRVLGLRPELINHIGDVIINQSLPQVCVNDSHWNTDPERLAEIGRCSFDAVLPEKSSFEKE